MFNNQQRQYSMEQPRSPTEIGEPNVFGTQTRIETTSDTGEVSDSEDEVMSILLNEERDSSGQTMQINSNDVDVTMDHFESPNGRDAVATINRLPVELLTQIIILASLKKTGFKHPFLSYTWVCRYWRLVIIHNPIFWTTIQLGSDSDFIDPFVQELLRRSDSMELDVMCSPHSAGILYFENFMATESNHDRIRNLWLQLRDDEHTILLASGRRFPALRGLAYTGGSYGLLSIIDASDHLETLQCTLQNPSTDLINLYRLGPRFGSIRNLQLTIPNTRQVVQYALYALGYNVNLQNLILIGRDIDIVDSTFETILPKLRFLSIDNPSWLKHIRAPTLSSLHVQFMDRDSLDMEVILEAFDYSSIKYLYVLDHGGNSHSILGLKERVYSIESDLLAIKAKNFIGCPEDIVSLGHIKCIKDAFSVNDILSDTFPRDCFRLTFRSLETFEEALGKLLCPLLSRMENLTELYLLSSALVLGYQGTIHEILSLSPSIEKAVIQYGHRLTDFIRPLSDTSLCPRLKYLSYITIYMGFIYHRYIEEYADDVGKTLTECLRLRQKVYSNELKYVALEQCPPLANTWLGEFRDLGVTVITAKDIESVLETRPDEGDPPLFKK